MLQMVRAVLAVLLLAVACRGEMFTALVDMEHLAYTERELLGMLDRAIQAEEQKILTLKKWVPGVVAGQERRRSGGVLWRSLEL